jgi:hypothetical protein
MPTLVVFQLYRGMSVISWQSVLLVEETGGPGENHWPVASHKQTLSHNVVSSTPRICKSNYHTITSLISWEAFFDPSDSYFLFAEERGYHTWALAHSLSCLLSNYMCRQTGSRNLMGPKTLPTIWGTDMELVTKYQICVIDSCSTCWEKCDEKFAYMFNVYKNQLSRQTGSRNLTGQKTLLIVYHQQKKKYNKTTNV